MRDCVAERASLFVEFAEAVELGEVFYADYYVRHDLIGLIRFIGFIRLIGSVRLV